MEVKKIKYHTSKTPSVKFYNNSFSYNYSWIKFDDPYIIGFKNKQITIKARETQFSIKEKEQKEEIYFYKDIENVHIKKENFYLPGICGLLILCFSIMGIMNNLLPQVLGLCSIMASAVMIYYGFSDFYQLHLKIKDKKEFKKSFRQLDPYLLRTIQTIKSKQQQRKAVFQTKIR